MTLKRDQILNIQFMIPLSIGLVGLESFQDGRVAGTVFILVCMFNVHYNSAKLVSPLIHTIIYIWFQILMNYILQLDYLSVLYIIVLEMSRQYEQRLQSSTQYHPLVFCLAIDLFVLCISEYIWICYQMTSENIKHQQGTTERLFFISAKTENSRNSHFSFWPKPIHKPKKYFCFGRNRYRN